MKKLLAIALVAMMSLGALASCGTPTINPNGAPSESVTDEQNEVVDDNDQNVDEGVKDENNGNTENDENSNGNENVDDNINDENTDNSNTDNGNTDSGNTDSGNTDSGNTDSGNTDGGNTDADDSGEGDEDTHDHEEEFPATCKTESKCSICGEPFGGLDEGNHEGEEEWDSTNEGHKKVYSCCGAVVEEQTEHTFVNSKCSVCEYECNEHEADGDLCKMCKAFVAHTYSNNKCVNCGLDLGKAEIAQGDAVYFGSYPQSAVTNSSLKTTLNSKAGTLPTALNAQNWISYGYEENETMWYIDIEYNGEKYRGVYYTTARPTHLDSNTGDQQTSNGYAVGTAYWFKYEPIKWTVLDLEAGKAFVLSELIIDAQPYEDNVSFSNADNRDEAAYNGSDGVPAGTYANNYEYSRIRNWLITTFYNTAFSDIQKEVILTTAVDNSDNVIGDYSNGNKFFSNDTEDKIFLLSKGEGKQTEYGFTYTKGETANDTRTKTVTDYAKVQGVSVGGTNGDGGWWWLRTPTYNSDKINKSDVAHNIKIAGTYWSSNVYLTTGGVVPAMWINI